MPATAVEITNTLSANPRLKRRWRNLEMPLKYEVVRLADGCADEQCLLKILKRVRRNHDKSK